MQYAQFVKVFASQLEALKGSERITRGVLRELSRNLLAALHGKDGQLFGDIRYVNDVLPVLTPVNRKVFLAFMKHFTGFHYDEAQGVFTKKSKKRAADAQINAAAFLEDPHNNIWSWAERHVQVEVKPFTADKVTDYITAAIKKMGGDQVKVLRAVIAAGITPANLAMVLQDMASDQKVVDAVVHGSVDPAPL